MNKLLFALPTRKPIFWITIASGLLFVLLSFGFKSDDAIFAQISFSLIGFGQILMGIAEFLPDEKVRIAIAMRLIALMLSAIAIFSMFMLFIQ